MTTAARPTWTPAMGGKGMRDNATHPVTQYSVRELPQQLTLKFRQPGQNSEEEIRKKNLRDELRRAELEHLKEAGKAYVEENDQPLGLESADELLEEKRRVLAEAALIDADSDSDGGGTSNSESEEEEDDEEDDTEELMRELEKIKRERAEEKARHDMAQAEEMDRLRAEESATGNPLLSLGDSASSVSGFGVKRRWDDDVVFKNQARGVDEKPKKRFINDLLRSDFHRKFMNRYIN